MSSPLIITQQSENSIRYEVKDETNVLIIDDNDSVRHSDSNQMVILESSKAQTPLMQKSARDGVISGTHGIAKERPLSMK